MIEEGAYVSYRIVADDNTYFPLEFEFEENAIKICDFFSKRDNTQYSVQKIYFEIGIPDYCDADMRD